VPGAVAGRVGAREGRPAAWAFVQLRGAAMLPSAAAHRRRRCHAPAGVSAMTARAAIALLALLPASPLAAQLRPERPALAAVRAAGAVRVDGRLTEAEWGAVPVGSGFVQRTPDPGAAATQPTEIRVQYDDDALYLAARMFDAHPDSIAAPHARRERPDHPLLGLDQRTLRQLR
jgi:hypothetical protein